jgi:transcriptional regulator with XRE-family HTH domain
MPVTDETAKAWELDLAERLGRAVRERRSTLGLSAQQVSDRTRDIGYPVTRVAISKIEGNLRSGKVDVAELFALARALEIPPGLLLFPDFPDGEIEVLPGKLVSSADALNWVAGQRSYPMGAGNEGTRLIEAADKLATLRDPLFEQQLVGDTPPEARTAEQKQAIEQILKTRNEGRTVWTRIIERSKSNLWGRGDA